MSAIKGAAGEQVGVMEWSTGTASSTPLAGTAISMKNIGKALFVFRLGDMANETVDCIVETCDSNGANNATLKSATQRPASASDNDSKIITISVDANELGASGKTHVRGKVTTGAGTGGTVSIAALGLEPRYGPVSAYDSTNVVEIKV